MQKLKLTYFDVDGGRGEPARLAMHMGNIEFEDFRFTFERFQEVIVTTPLRQVPTLTIDGLQLTQCNAINRFVGKMAGLYPEDPYQALLCDEIMEALEDVVDKLVATFGLQDDALKTAREKLASGPITHYLKFLEQRLAERGGAFFADNRLTMADLKVFVWVKALNSGHLDHIPTDLVKALAPMLNDHFKRVISTPKIAEYYANRAND